MILIVLVVVSEIYELRHIVQLHDDVVEQLHDERVQHIQQVVQALVALIKKHQHVRVIEHGAQHLIHIHHVLIQAEMDDVS